MERAQVPDVLLVPWLAIVVVVALLRPTAHLHPTLEVVEVGVEGVASCCPKLETEEAGMAVLMTNSHQKREAAAAVD